MVRSRVHQVLVALAVASLLSACAGTAPAGSQSKKSALSSGSVAATSKPAATSSAQTKAETPKREKEGKYRLVTKDGQDFYCRKQVVTGTRVQNAETCLTAEQMKAVREGTQEALRDMQGIRGEDPIRDTGERTLTFP